MRSRNICVRLNGCDRSDILQVRRFIDAIDTPSLSNANRAPIMAMSLALAREGKRERERELFSIAINQNASFAVLFMTDYDSLKCLA